MGGGRLHSSPVGNEAAAAKLVPRVVTLSATPKVIGPSGGTVVVSGRTSGGVNCSLHVSAPGLTLVYSKAARSCSDGTFLARVVVWPNPAHEAVQARVRLVVSKGHVVDGLSVEVDVEAEGGQGQARGNASTAPVTTTPAPAVTTTTPVPGGAAAAVPAGGGAPVPALSTTTPVPATTGPTTTVPAPTSSAAPVSALLATSQNWSGYAVTAGPFSSVQGTFTVPTLSASTTCGQHTSEWVGVDGFSVSGSNQDLIQAGIDESVINPYTGVCTPGSVYVVPWWEILPAAETPISAMTVSAGDTVTVQISQISPSLWSIAMTDQTTGQAFSTQQPYSGSGASAEWVLEAPLDQVNCGGICQLAPYCVTQAGGCGPVVFSSVEATGAQAQWWEISMDQGAGAVSTPSALSGNSFTVSYSAVSNGAFMPGLSGRPLSGRTAMVATGGARTGLSSPTVQDAHGGSGVYQG